MHRARWFLLLLAGCGHPGAHNWRDASDRGAPAALVVANGAAAPAVGPIADPPPAAVINHKIIHTADVQLVVEDFAPVPERISALARTAGGYVARSNLHGAPGSPRGGDWTLRVPVARYEQTLADLQSLGEVRQVSSNSQDVTEEFVDVEARIRNKKQEEARLLTHLEKSTGNLEEILRIERELSRIRGEIEQVEGRLRVLADATALSTIKLTVMEIKNYVPEAAPTYGTRVKRTFSASLAGLINGAADVSIVCVAVAPWLLAFGAPLGVCVFALRRRLRGHGRPRAAAPHGPFAAG